MRARAIVSALRRPAFDVASTRVTIPASPLMLDQNISRRVIGSHNLSGLPLAEATKKDLGHVARVQLAQSPLFDNSKEIFPELPTIQYKGPQTRDPLAYRYYHPDTRIPSLDMTLGQVVNDALPFWHGNTSGADMFGGATISHPWDVVADPLLQNVAKIRGLFEFMGKLGIRNYCFHDGDIVDLTQPIEEAEAQLDFLTGILKNLQAQTGINLGWNTNQFFAIPLYSQGVGTSPAAAPVVRAARQAKKSLDIAMELGAKRFVFWGGREGYWSLLNTMTKTEKDNLAAFLRMNVEYAKKIGFFAAGGVFLIEPKGKEPTMHQYDHDVETCIAFLKTYGLDKYFKLNVEGNHALLASHTPEHEFTMAIDAGMLGGIDANTGDDFCGWDTDRITDLMAGIAVGRALYRNKGLQGGVANHDAKLRRDSTDFARDYAIALVHARDSIAFGVWLAHFINEDGRIPRMLAERYQTLAELQQLLALPRAEGITDLEHLATQAIGWEKAGKIIVPPSARQEQFQKVYDNLIVSTDQLIQKAVAAQFAK